MQEEVAENIVEEGQEEEIVKKKIRECKGNLKRNWKLRMTLRKRINKVGKEENKGIIKRGGQ